MNRVGLTIIKNASANVVRGGAAAVVALLLPHFLAKALDVDRFSSWSLILQIAAYAGYLDFGLQTALARFVAQAVELEQKERRDGLVSTALGLLTIAGCVALVVIGFVIWQLPRIFHGIPASLLFEVQTSALILTASASLMLPLSTYTGILLGLHRNEFPAMAIGGSRICGAIAVVISSKHTHSLIIFSSCIAMSNLVGALIQWAAVRRLLPDLKAPITRPQRQIGMELLYYCLGLTVFSFGMLLVSGLDVTIVGHFDFRTVGYYSIATIAITFVAGINNSVISAMMTPVAALHARREIARIADLVIRSTKLIVVANMAITLFAFYLGPFLLRYWVGPVYAIEALPVLKVLVIAQTIRLGATAFTIMLIATGQQNKAIESALVEAFVNLIASVIGAIYFGALGVAWGTLIGSICGIVWLLFRTVPKLHENLITASELLRSLLRPALYVSPLIANWMIGGVLWGGGRIFTATSWIAAFMTLLLFWLERDFLREGHIGKMSLP